MFFLYCVVVVFFLIFNFIFHIRLKKVGFRLFLIRFVGYNVIFSLILTIFLFYWAFCYHFFVFLIIFLINFLFYFFLNLFFFVQIRFLKDKIFNLFLISFSTSCFWIFLIFLFNNINYSGVLFEYSIFFYSSKLILFFSTYQILFFFLFFVILISFKIEKDFDLFLNFKKSFKLDLSWFLFIFLLLFFLFFFTNFDFSLVQNDEVLDDILIDKEFLISQANIDKSFIYRAENVESIFEVYKNLSKVGKNYDLIIWPEYSLSVDIFKEDYYMKLLNLSRDLNTTIVLGHIIDLGKYGYDSASVFSRGSHVGTYNSIEPLFFNEPTIGADNFFVFQIDDVKFGIIICYEELNRDIIKEYKRLGVDVIISLSNNQHLQGTLGQEFVSAFVDYRASEFNVSVLRASNTGVSKIVNSRGDVVRRIPIGVRKNLCFAQNCI